MRGFVPDGGGNLFLMGEIEININMNHNGKNNEKDE